MAYALQDEKDQFQQSWTPRPAQAGGAPAGGSAGSAIAPGAPAQSAPGSKFVSFDRYLSANQDAAAKTGEKLGYGVQQKGREATSALQEGETAFAGATNKGMGGTLGSSQNPTRTILPPSGPASFQQQGDSASGTTVITRSAQPLQAQTGYSPEEAAALAETKYTGPTNLADFRPELRAQVEGAQRTAAQLGTEQGRRALLTESAQGGPVAYGGGHASLDEALATGVGDNRERFRKTANTFGQLGKWLGDAETNAAKTADTARKTTESEAGRFKGMLTDYKAEQEGNAAATAASEGEATQVRDVEDFIGKYAPNDKEKERLRPAVADFRKRYGRVPTERELFGFTHMAQPLQPGRKE